MMADCPICLAELSHPLTTPCGHSFCERCIRAAFYKGGCAEAPDGFGFCPVCRDFISASSLDGSDDHAASRESNGPLSRDSIRASDGHAASTEGPFGMVFVEFGGGLWMEGMDSYHFTDAATCGAYIDYHGYDSTERTRFDDGSMPPKTKAFTATSFDPARRCFRGTVDWSPRSWVFKDAAGVAYVEQRWEFELYFAAGFGTISRGEVRDYNPEGELVAIHRIGEEGWQYARRELIAWPHVDAGGGAESGKAAVCSAGAAAAVLGEERTAALRAWIDETNPTLGQVLQRLQELRGVGETPPLEPPDMLEVPDARPDGEGTGGARTWARADTGISASPASR